MLCLCVIDNGILPDSKTENSTNEKSKRSTREHKVNEKRGRKCEVGDTGGDIVEELGVENREQKQRTLPITKPTTKLVTHQAAKALLEGI